MPDLNALQRRIEVASDLLGITRTMKTLAAVSIRQYEEAVEALARYFDAVDEGLRMFFWRHRGRIRMRSPSPAAPVGLIVFGAEQGLCGGFNEQVVQAVREHADQHRRRGCTRLEFVLVGTRLQVFAPELTGQAFAWRPLPGGVDGITPLVDELLTVLEEWRHRRRIERVELVHQRRVHAAATRPRVFALLPFPAEREAGQVPSRWPGRSLPRLDLPADVLLSTLLREWLFVALYRAAAESLMAENAARIAAMQSAQRNIEERVTELRLAYHQARQTAITEELLEVASGFEVLRRAESDSGEKS
ncbi:MAG: F0F1 ATP synthase subunit gamma [Planctomycetota bacterium]|nr:MAG: F0F1 ATP synthase subunit gamma [Planctomycetota bacterium]